MEGQKKRWDSIPSFCKHRILFDAHEDTNIPKVCSICKLALARGIVPRYSNMRLPEALPEVDELSYFEERLVSLMTPFAHISEAPLAQNMQLKEKLPRKWDEHSTISAVFKGDLKLERAWKCGNVRPFHVACAMEGLMKTPLYLSCNVSNRPEWEGEWGMEENSEYLGDSSKCVSVGLAVGGDEHVQVSLRVIFDVDSDEGAGAGAPGAALSEAKAEHSGTSIHRVPQPSQTIKEGNLSPCGSEDLDDVTAGYKDTVLKDLPMEDAHIRRQNEEDYLGKVWNIAPGQGQRAKSPLYVLHGEEKCFPKIYHGSVKHHCSTMKGNSLSEMINWEVAAVDRRCAGNLFYKQRALLLNEVQRDVNINVRQGSIHDRRFTAGQVRSPTVLRDLLGSNIGHAALKQVKGTPTYLKARRNELFALMRQEGPPTFFFTFSPCDTKWRHLLHSNLFLKNGAEPLDEYLDFLLGGSDAAKSEVADLLRSDPVMVARTLENSFNGIIEKIKNDAGLIGPVKHMWRVTEVQGRLPKHIHGIIHVYGSPSWKPDGSNESEMVTFIDKYLSCDTNLLPEHLRALHMHKHMTNYCKANKKAACRFEFPEAPMKSTKILTPLRKEDILKAKAAGPQREQDGGQLEKTLAAAHALIEATKHFPTHSLCAPVHRAYAGCELPADADTVAAASNGATNGNGKLEFYHYLKAIASRIKNSMTACNILMEEEATGVKHKVEKQDGFIGTLGKVPETADEFWRCLM
eukprot:1162154-Pelagomonas_calceolata.AAC.7